VIAVVAALEPGDATAESPPQLGPGLLEKTAAWYDAVSNGHSHLEFVTLPAVRAPKPVGYYSYAGGKGPWPYNSQRLAADLVRALPADRLASLQGTDCRLLIVAADRFLPHTWHIPRAGVPSERMWIRRYAIVSHTATAGMLAHEMGHLAFDWPDLRWPPEGEMECLMARGATGANANTPAPPSAPLQVKAGWREPVKVARNLTVRGLAARGVGAVEWQGKHLLVETRPGRLLLFTSDPIPSLVARIPLDAGDERKLVLGLLGPRLRRFQV
jgi:hypothetical protein